MGFFFSDKMCHITLFVANGLMVNFSELFLFKITTIVFIFHPYILSEFPCFLVVHCQILLKIYKIY